MSIMNLHAVGMSFGDYDVFSGMTASVARDAKIGLVGPNGIGKTTLLGVLAGVEQSTAGHVTYAQGTRIGYLRQEAMAAFAERQNTLHGEMLNVFAELRGREQRLREMEHQMAEGEASEALFEEYARAQDAFERDGGYNYEWWIDQVLQGLGFGRQDYRQPLAQMSGGQKTRALMARLLLERPDLLILDEPTNHLDVDAVEWLEETLRTWDGALIVVSHDRYFLDRVVNNIWEMSLTGMETYRGNYSAYLTQRQERWERREIEFETARERFLSELDYIKKNIARDSTNAQAVGRLKRLIREVRVVQQGGLSLLNTQQWGKVMEEIEISSTRWGVADVESAIKGLRSPVVRPPVLAMRLKPATRSGNLVLRSSELEIGFPTRSLFRADPIVLERGECAALIGPNGSGKTTFLRTLLGEIPPLQGEVRLGASLKLGYFAQAHTFGQGMNSAPTEFTRFGYVVGDPGDPAAQGGNGAAGIKVDESSKSVLDTLIDYRHMTLGEARSYLGQYLFRGEDVYKRLDMLSGGERGRLALALLALNDANLLLLDEPTNHLDIPTQEVLQRTLENFQGTILLVSHDRYLIDRLATQIWELRGGRLHVFSGTLAEHNEAKRLAAERQKTARDVERRETRREGMDERQQRIADRKRQEAATQMEQRVHKLEEELARIAAELDNASQRQDVAAVTRLGFAWQETQQQLENAMEEWAALAEE